jgi:hypothetical protein
MVLGTILVLAVSGWAQSLGDVARADHERAKPHAKTLFTNDNLPEPTAEDQSEPTDGLQIDLAHVRGILRGICSDPRTQNGHNLSDSDKEALNEAVKPLRVRVNDVEQISSKYKEALATLSEELRAKVVKAVYVEHPLTDADIQKVKSLRQEYDARRAALLQQAQADMAGFQGLQQQLESVGRECPAAAETVPD